MSYPNRVLASINDVKVWHLDSVDTDNGYIHVAFKNNLGDKIFDYKTFTSCWGINRPETCPDYDNYQITAIAELLRIN